MDAQSDFNLIEKDNEMLRFWHPDIAVQMLATVMGFSVGVETRPDLRFGKKITRVIARGCTKTEIVGGEVQMPQW